MRAIHRGHEITVERASPRDPTGTLLYAVFRVADGLECVSGVEDSAETCRSMAANLRARIDAELASADPWGERAAAGGVWPDDPDDDGEPDERLREID